MSEVAFPSATDLSAAVKTAVEELFSVKYRGGSTYLSFPLIYQSGSGVVLKIDLTVDGVRISDNGSAYQEVVSIGGEGFFNKTAAEIAKDAGLQADRRSVFIEVPVDQLHFAICDVGLSSWRVADRICKSLDIEENGGAEEILRQKLPRIFGGDRIRFSHQVAGRSMTAWDVSAMVDLDDRVAVFQAVSNHPDSIFRASTAFRDIAELDRPPRLVAVVRDKEALGPKLHLLSREGRVIEANQPDDAFIRAVA